MAEQTICIIYSIKVLVFVYSPFVSSKKPGETWRHETHGSKKTSPAIPRPTKLESERSTNQPRLTQDSNSNRSLEDAYFLKVCSYLHECFCCFLSGM